MSVTYTEDQTPYGDRVDAVSEETFVPIYARRGKAAKRGGKVKTWMILAPIGAVVLVGAVAAMAMGGGERAADPALVEPAATAPVLPTAPLETEAAVAPLTTAATPAPVEAVPVAPAPAAREAAPVRRAAPPAERRAEAPAPRVTPAPAQPTTPQPYSAPATSNLNTAPATPAPTPAPASAPEPSIVVQPLS